MAQRETTERRTLLSVTWASGDDSATIASDYPVHPDDLQALGVVVTAVVVGALKSKPAEPPY